MITQIESALKNWGEMLNQNSLWNLLKSMKFAVWLLVVLGTASLISMFIVEFYPLDSSFENWEQIYSDKYGWFFPVMKVLQLGDPYRSWWYQLMLGILSLSLLTCVIDRIPISIRRAFGKVKPFTKQEIEHYSNSKTFQTGHDFVRRFTGSLKKYSVHQKVDNGVVYLDAGRGRLAAMGPVFTHIGLLLLALGGFFSIWGISDRGFGYPGDIIESENFDFQVRVDDFRIEYYPLGAGQWVLVDDRSFGKIARKLSDDLYRLKFFMHEQEIVRDIEASRIRNQFDIESDRGNIKDYISDLSIIEDGKVIDTRSIEVNKPMRHRGFRFYQSSFDSRNPKVISSLDSGLVEITDIKSGIVLDTISFVLGHKYLLADGSELVLSDFLPHFQIGDSGPISASSNLKNPAVKAAVYRGGGELYHQWLFLLHDFHGSQEEAAYSFRLLDLYNPVSEGKYMTILEIKENQGYEVIWAGLILASIGVMLSFYVVQRQFRAVAIPSGKGYEVTIGGSAPREKIHFAEEFKLIINRIKQKSTAN